LSIGGLKTSFGSFSSSFWWCAHGGTYLSSGSKRPILRSFHVLCLRSLGW
jgi:hypothetical protein